MLQAALLLCLAVIPASAQDAGEALRFSGQVIRSQPVSPRALPGGLLFTLLSDAPQSDYDAVLIHGVLPEAGVRLEASRLDGGRWTPWRPMRLKRFAGGRFWARGDFYAASRGPVRLRALEAGARKAHTVMLYGAEVFRGGLERAGRGAAGGAGAERPPVVERGQWGAAPARAAYEPHMPARISQHHTAGPRPVAADAALAEMRFIQDYHQEGRGWSDIGYHYLVDGAGRVYAGRPEGAQGAHVRGRNAGNVGIAVMGYHHEPHHDPLAPVQAAAIRRLLAYLGARYGIAPADYLAHRDQVATSCPGDIVYEKLGDLRSALEPPPAPEPAPVRASLKRMAGAGR